MNHDVVVSQLGCGYSTARNRLTNYLIFDMLTELGRAVCHRCGEPLSREDCTIEHKVPWLHEDNAVELFYDVGNIAFSHGVCNARAKRSLNEVEHGGGTSGKKNCPCDLCKVKKAQYQKLYKSGKK